VVVQVDIDRFGGFAQLACDLEIGAAWGWITARMVVNADDRGGAMSDRLAENFPRMGEAVGRSDGADLDLLDQTVLSIQTEHPEFLDFESGQQCREMGDHRGGFFESPVSGFLLLQYPPGDLHHGNQLQGLHATDSLEPPEILLRPRNQSDERTRFRDQMLCNRKDIVSFAAAAQQHREQLGVAQGRGPVFLEAFLRTLANGEIF